MAFQHDRLDVYRLSLDVSARVFRLLKRVARDVGGLRNQLLRAVISITLNIAEGAEEFSPADKARFYRFARRSAAECAACLDTLVAWGELKQTDIREIKRLLGWIVGKLTNMIAAMEARLGSTSVPTPGSRDEPMPVPMRMPMPIPFPPREPNPITR